MTVDQHISEAKAARIDTTDEDQQALTESIMDMLSAASGKRNTNENGITQHDPQGGTAPVISIRKGVSADKAAKFLNGYVVSQAQEAVYELPPEIKCRPMDGAVNVNLLMKRIYGMGSVGKEQRTMFGTNPPMTLTVETDFGKHMSVPWGLIDLPEFEGEIYLGQKSDPDYGLLFHAYIKCPKKYEEQIEGFWNLLRVQIRDNSIYKGKAVVGVGKIDPRTGEYEHPKFLDPNAIDPAKVAYTQDVFDRLDASVWGPIKTADIQRQLDLNLNLKTLLFGTYGTGKSLAGGLTARVAVENGWTFIQTKTGDENLNMVLRTAELLAPAVVFIEDVDIMMDADPKKMAELLEQFDGVSSKNKEVMVLMTSNHVESLSKGMTRVGRIDAAIEIGSLDRDAIQKLINAMFEPHMLAPDINWEAIYESMMGYEPAFIMGTFKLTKRIAVNRTRSTEFQLTTDDFVLAAQTLRNQHDTHTNAADRPVVDQAGVVLKGLTVQAVEETLENYRVDFQDNGDIVSVG